MIKDYNIADNAAIHPSKIMGMSLGTRDYFHVAPVDSAYWTWLIDTVPANRMFSTLAEAHVHMTADRGDTALIYPGTYTQSTTALTWSKDQCHIIGVGPRHDIEHPIQLTNGNADETPTGGNWVFSANECYVSNICFRQRGALQNLVNVSVTGDNNVFEDIHFHNAANTATADEAGQLGVSLNGANNLIFRRCTFGGTEIQRTDGAVEVSIGAGTCDNLHFYDCLFISDLSAAADADHFFVKLVADADLGKYMVLDYCTFVNCGAAAALPAAIDIGAAAAGECLLREPTCVSITDICTTEEKIWITGGAPTATTTGIAIHNNSA